MGGRRLRAGPTGARPDRRRSSCRGTAAKLSGRCGQDSCSSRRNARAMPEDVRPRLRLQRDGGALGFSYGNDAIPFVRTRSRDDGDDRLGVAQVVDLVRNAGLDEDEVSSLVLDTARLDRRRNRDGRDPRGCRASPRSRRGCARRRRRRAESTATFIDSCCAPTFFPDMPSL